MNGKHFSNLQMKGHLIFMVTVSDVSWNNSNNLITPLNSNIFNIKTSRLAQAWCVTCNVMIVRGQVSRSKLKLTQH